MKNVDDYNLAMTSENVNTLMQRVLDRIKANSVIDAPLDWNLATALNHEMQNLAQVLDDKEISEMKHYEFSCDIELYPMVQYIDANSAEEAMELMEQIINVLFAEKQDILLMIVKKMNILNLIVMKNVKYGVVLIVVKNLIHIKALHSMKMSIVKRKNIVIMNMMKKRIKNHQNVIVVVEKDITLRIAMLQNTLMVIILNNRRVKYLFL